MSKPKVNLQEPQVMFVFLFVLVSVETCCNWDGKYSFGNSVASLQYSRASMH